MKFSFSLIKKLLPGKYDEKFLAEKLNLHSFETADLGNGVLDISVPANRFSDCASHLGVAFEASVIFKTKLNNPFSKALKFDLKSAGPSVKIQDKNLCSRYLAAFVKGVKVGPSPKWLKDILEECGLRSINNVVDVMNYVMLEIGRPLHAFDADKLKGGIVVRKAKKGEKIETIDNQKFNLDNDVLVIADSKQPLAIAGIKGGKAGEVTAKTKNILVEAANFDGVNIYKTSRKLGLRTDASVRFMHDLNPALTELGLLRALSLLKELTGGKISKPTDVYLKKPSKKLLELDIQKINKLIGYDFKEKELADLFSRLGFKKEGKLWQVPEWRPDINNLEDLAEEAARFMGYNQLPVKIPAVALSVAEEEEQILLKDKVRNFLKGAGFSEVYNYSFVSEAESGLAPKAVFGFDKAVALANPISGQLGWLRDSLAPGISRNLKDNLRFSEIIRIFEIGKIFGLPGQGAHKEQVQEKLILAIGLVAKDGLLELKGLADGFLSQLGLTDYLMPDLNLPSKLLNSKEALLLETDEHQVLGYFGTLQGIKNGAALEIDLEKLLKEVDEEREFEPLPKYPAIVRDISILVSASVRVAEILNLLYAVNVKLVEDADLIDFYEDPKLGKDKKSLTFRIVFRSDDRTLTDAEADREMAIINQLLTDKFNAELR